MLSHASDCRRSERRYDPKAALDALNPKRIAARRSWWWNVMRN
jgi:hypothetical protein